MRMLVLALLLPAAAAQTALVHGTVVNEDGAPMAGVSVYLSGTARGDATDAEGRYRLPAVPPGTYQVVGSMVGFEPATARIEASPGDTLRTDLTLYAALRTVGLVRVEAPRDTRWRDHRARFEAALLGESSLADSVRIANPEALEFRERGGELQATAAKPLVIENRALGYRLTYDLGAFERTAAEVRYEGTERFEPLAPRSAAEATRWAAARVRAYRGSLRHLLRALRAGTADHEGFRFLLSDAPAEHYTEGTFTGDTGRPRPTAARRLVDRDRSGAVRLSFRGRLEVRYAEPEDPAFLASEWFQGPRRAPSAEQVSTLELRDGPVAIDAQGTLADPLAVVARGYLGFERLADLLPADYVLPPRD